MTVTVPRTKRLFSTITSSMPVEVDGEFLGVICADELVSALEGAMLPSLAGLPNATLVNTGGRVVVSTDPDFETGDRYAGADPVRGIEALQEELMKAEVDINDWSR